MDPTKQKKIDELKFFNRKAAMTGGKKALMCFLCPDRACGFTEATSQKIADTRYSQCKEDVKRIRDSLIKPEDADKCILITAVEDIEIPEEML